MSGNLVLYKNLSELDIDFPEIEQKLTKKVVTEIQNAFEDASIVDKNGVLWIRLDKLHIVLRTDKPTAKQIFLGVQEGKWRREFGEYKYLRGSQVIALIWDQLDVATGTKENGLLYARDVLDHIRVLPEIENIKLRAILALQSQRKSLKSEKIKKNKINRDELTGEPLKHGLGSEFSHIISAASDAEISDQPWNGVVVNKTTHKKITNFQITNEDELYNFCQDMSWSLSWYGPFCQAKDEFYRNYKS
jgi:hypothetical protein